MQLQRAWLFCLLARLVGGAVNETCSAAHRRDFSLAGQVRRALGGAATKEALATRLIDDHFDYLRAGADASIKADDAAGVHALVARVAALGLVPVLEVRSDAFNTSALCAFLRHGVPALRAAPNVKAYVLLSLGAAAHASPFHPAILRALKRGCGAGEAQLRRVLLEPKLRRWFVSQHFPAVDSSWSDRPKEAHADVGDTRRALHWVMHPKLHHVPLGVPRIFSKFDGCETRIDSDPSIYVNFKPRRYREAVVATLRARLGAALPNMYVGTQRVRSRAAVDTRDYVGAMFSHKFVLSPPGSGIDCYRHWEALLCGAVPIVEYNPLVVELLAGLPAIIVRDWADVDAKFLRAKYDQLAATTFDFERLTTAFWRAELQRTKGPQGA